MLYPLSYEGCCWLDLTEERFSNRSVGFPQKNPLQQVFLAQTGAVGGKRCCARRPQVQRAS